MPSILRPQKGRFHLVDYEKAYCADANADIFELRAVNRDAGCMILVRPDQFVTDVLAPHRTRPTHRLFERHRCAYGTCQIGRDRETVILGVDLLAVGLVDPRRGV